MVYAGNQGMAAKAPTLAFTTFVLFQFFNVFNSRVERGTAFNRYFFKNTMLWAALCGVIALQIIAVEWPPAQSVFGTQPLNLADWALAVVVASSVLILEESRKFLVAGLDMLRTSLKFPRASNS